MRNTAPVATYDRNNIVNSILHLNPFKYLWYMDGTVYDDPFPLSIPHGPYLSSWFLCICFMSLIVAAVMVTLSSAAPCREDNNVVGKEDTGDTTKQQQQSGDNQKDAAKSENNEGQDLGVYLDLDILDTRLRQANCQEVLATVEELRIVYRNILLACRDKPVMDLEHLRTSGNFRLVDDEARLIRRLEKAVHHQDEDRLSPEVKRKVLAHVGRLRTQTFQNLAIPDKYSRDDECPVLLAFALYRYALAIQVVKDDVAKHAQKKCATFEDARILIMALCETLELKKEHYEPSKSITDIALNILHKC